jgi:transcriptional regulator with XRE-family HTH domain
VSLTTHFASDVSFKTFPLQAHFKSLGGMASKTPPKKGHSVERRLPNELTLAVGQNLKALRGAAGKTQVELAFDAEVERSRISKLESGLVNPSLLTLGTLCYCLGVGLPALFKGVTATVPPMSQGGVRRRANQATLEKAPASRRSIRR